MGANAAMNVMMGWMKWMASWVLSLFRLNGSGGFSPLTWISDNWIKLLVFFMIVGVAADVLVWLMRWRPYWVWFHKKRIVINDDNFFAGEELVDAGLYDPSLFFDPQLDKPKRRAEQRPAPSTIVPPARPRPRLITREEPAPRRPIREEPAPRRAPAAQAVRPRAAAPTRRPGEKRTIFSAGRAPRKAAQDPLFSVDPASAVDPATGEAAVFNVSDLPVSRDELAFRHKRH